MKNQTTLYVPHYQIDAENKIALAYIASVAAQIGQLDPRAAFIGHIQADEKPPFEHEQPIRYTPIGNSRHLNLHLLMKAAFTETEIPSSVINQIPNKN